MPKKVKTKKQRYHSTKIRYNEPGMPELFWRIKYTDAKEPVKLRSTIKEALAGKPGSSVGCHLSLCADENRSQFPHPYVLAAFLKSTVFVITSLKKKGKFDGEAVRYEHRMGKYVDLNDEDHGKEVFKTWPELANMEFTLYPPYSHFGVSRGGVGGRGKGSTTGERSPKVMRGALGRAVKAGLVDAPIAKALEKMADA